MSGYKLDCRPDNPYLLTREEQRRAERLVREGACEDLAAATQLIKRHRKVRPGGAPPGPSKGDKEKV